MVTKVLLAVELEGAIASNGALMRHYEVEGDTARAAQFAAAHRAALAERMRLGPLGPSPRPRRGGSGQRARVGQAAA